MAEARDRREDRPWEQRGVLRRDCEPHRAETLTFLANLSVVCGVLSIVLVLPAVLGIPLGAYTWWRAMRDLRQMDEGQRDPHGFAQTLRAGARGRLGLSFSLLWVVVALVLGVVYAVLALLLPLLAR